MNSGARISTHISNSKSPTFAVAFFQAMKDGGYEVHEAGFSFYPSAGGGPAVLTDFRKTVEAVKADLGPGVVHPPW